MAVASIDLNSQEFLMDPYPVYRELRERESPVWIPHRGPTGGVWLFTRYDEVVAILKEARISRALSRVLLEEPPTPLERSMLNQDPPAHTRLRALGAKAFAAIRIKDFEPRIASIAAELLAGIRARGRADFVADYATPLTSTVIAEVLGVPTADQKMFSAWTHRVAANFDTFRSSDAVVSGAADALKELTEYFTRLIRARRQRPTTDFISALVQARDVHDRLTEEELLGSCMLLLIAGSETTERLLGNGLLTLLRSPDQLALLRREPALMLGAVEEILRYESPAQRALFRVARETFSIGAAEIEAGQLVSAVIGAANRDPKHFDDPERFDVRRDPNRHLAFGSGIHFCLGAPLARAQARISFEQVLKQLPGVRLCSEHANWNASTQLRGLNSLPVEV